MTLPHNRVRTDNEVRATVALLNGPESRGWWYASKAHVIMYDGDGVDSVELTRQYFDADTMEELPRKVVAHRIQEYEDWMKDEINRRRTYSESYASGIGVPPRQR